MTRIIKIEVVKYQGKWEVRVAADFGEYGFNEHFRYRTKLQAVLVARFRGRRLAKEYGTSVELIIKNQIGIIRDKDTYGYDPEKSEG